MWSNFSLSSGSVRCSIDNLALIIPFVASVGKVLVAFFFLTQVTVAGGATNAWYNSLC